MIEARLQLYLYTIDAQPCDPLELDVLCIEASSELRGLLFDTVGRLQSGAAAVAPPAPRDARLADHPLRGCAGAFCATLLPSPGLFRGYQRRPRQTAEHSLLHAQLPPFRMRRDRRVPLELADFRVGGIDQVFYIPNYLSVAEESQVAAQLAATPAAMWQRMQGRRVQECGSHVAESGAGLVLDALPPWMGCICDRLLADGVFPRAMPPNSVSLNEYSAEQGIAPHAVSCSSPCKGREAPRRELSPPVRMALAGRADLRAARGHPLPLQPGALSLLRTAARAATAARVGRRD